MKTFLLPTGEMVMVDDEDFAFLSKYSWHLNRGQWRCSYASTNTRDEHGNKIRVKMHRLIIGATKDQQVDHRNGDPLDNRRSNLRIVTNAENGRAFCQKSKGCTSRFRGVSLIPSTQRWRASVTKDRLQYAAGCYATEEEAAEAYNKKALELGFFYEALNKVA